jgi:hypothetical protein
MHSPKLAGIAAALLLASALAGCNRVAETRVSAEEAVLERQIQGLESLIRAAKKGPLIPFEQVLVVVDQSLIHDLLEAVTPYERVVGKFRIRVESAEVSFDDGFALVRLDGRASRAGLAFEEDASAEISVFGGLDIVELDPASGVLRGRVKIMAVEARRAAVLGMKAPVERLVEDLSRERLEQFSSLAQQLEIPVRLDQKIVLPAVGPAGGVRIEATTIPVRAAVKDVKAYRGKLWVAVSVAAAAS